MSTPQSRLDWEPVQQNNREGDVGIRKMNQPKTIIIVDDDDIVRIGLRTILTELGRYEVVGEASNGRDAVRMARKLEPDLVLIDVGMPTMNGIDATKRIKSAVEKTRVIALSLHDDSRFVTQMLDAGASGFLPKQGAVEELPFALKTVEAGNTYLSPAIAASVLTHFRHGEGGSSSSELSVREREVLQSIAEGKSASEIAKELSLSVKTIESHRRNIMKKLDLYSVAELTKFAIKEGLTGFD
ncbi:MAG: response regulator transcription factor [Pseudomonadota bacterium]